MRKILANIEEILASIALVILIMLVCINVFLRFTTSKSINWMEEIVFMCFSYVIFLGASAAFKRNLHSGIDLLVKNLPESAQGIVSMITTFILLVTCIVVTILSYKFAIGSGMKKTPILRIPYVYMDFSVVIGFAMMTFHCVMFIINLIKKKDYFREIPLYKDIYCYSSADDEAIDNYVSDNKEVKA